MGLDEDKRDTSWDNVDEVSTLSRLTERQRKTVRELRAKYAKMPEYDVVATLDMGHVAEVFTKRAKLTGETMETIAAGVGIPMWEVRLLLKDGRATLKTLYGVAARLGINVCTIPGKSVIRGDEYENLKRMAEQ